MILCPKCGGYVCAVYNHPECVHATHRCKNCLLFLIGDGHVRPQQGTTPEQVVEAIAVTISKTPCGLCPACDPVHLEKCWKAYRTEASAILQMMRKAGLLHPDLLKRMLV